MKVYKCDSCGKTIEKPYNEKMKEFCLTADYNPTFGVFWLERKTKIKIHLCEECFYGLKSIAAKKKSEAEQNEL